MTTREQLEQEAAELYPGSSYEAVEIAKTIARQQAHVHAKTISVEQAEKAARAGYTDGFMKHAPQPHPAGSAWEDIPEDSRDSWRRVSRAAFKAIGFTIQDEKGH